MSCTYTSRSDLRDLIDHTSYVTSEQTVGEVFHLFAARSLEFMAVLEGDTLLGMCSKRDISVLLGTQYGYSLFAQKRIRDHLMEDPMYIPVDSDIHDVFSMVFSRCEQTFYDDVLVLDENGKFVGFIHALTLVKLQNRFHVENIRRLEEQQRELNRKNAQMEADLRMSQELQQALLPERYPTFPPCVESVFSSLHFYHYYQPLDTVGGDFFYVKQLDDFIAGIFLADVMGHGVRAALITAMFRALLEKRGQDALNPSRLLAQLNSEITTILKKINQEVVYATALYLVLDVRCGMLHYATAGHPGPIHVRNRLGLVEVLQHPEPGTVLGVFDDAVFATHERKIESKDRIVLFTDGIVEVEDE